MTFPDDALRVPIEDIRNRAWSLIEVTLPEEDRVREDHLLYLFHYAGLFRPRARIVEIGVYRGASLLTMARALQGTNSKVTGVDPCLDPTWETRELAKTNQELRMALGDEDARLEAIQAKACRLGLDALIELIPATSVTARAEWAEPLDMVFVDGNHTYEDVLLDCEWLSSVRPGGIAVFDDWIAPVEQAVRDYLQDKPEWALISESTRQPPGYPWKTCFRKQGHGS